MLQALPYTANRPTISLKPWLALILGVGLLLRLWLWWRVPLHQPANDEVEYLQVARDLVAGRGWVFYEHYHWLRAPLYPLFLAGSLLLAGGDLRWAALPNVAVSTGTIYLVYLLGRLVVRSKEVPVAVGEAWAVRAGLFAAGVSAVLLPLATFASLWMSETLFMALFVGACVMLLRWVARPTLGSATCAGVLLGLAILTRSIPLAALPLLGVWMLWQRQRHGPLRPYVTGAALCLLVTLGMIAPWALRNWLAYGGFIPVETGLSYNLWAFNEPHEDADTIFRTLESIPNPVDRAAFATAKGLQRLREDPTIILRRLQFNWFYLWNINPVEDRFRRPSYYEDVPLGMFIMALVLDDGLYLFILGSAIAGFLLAPRSAQKTLLGGWFVYVVVATLLTHSEGRYRQLLLPVLIPFAASLWVGRWWPMVRPQWRLASLAIALIALWPLRHYPYSWAATNIRREFAELAGDQAMARGDYTAAQAAYRRATIVDPDSADALLKLGMAYDRNGQLSQSVEIYDRAVASAPLYIAASVRLGDVLRRMGAKEAARRAFAVRYTEPRLISDWGWRNLRGPAPSRVEVGDGLDIGFVSGMYAPEQSGGRRVRWTTGNAAIRLAGGTQQALVQLGLAAPRPDGRTVRAELCVVDRCQGIEVGAQWRIYVIYVAHACHSRTACKAPLEVHVRSPTFVPAQATAKGWNGLEDDRRLGLLVDYAAMEPVPARRVVPDGGRTPSS